MTDLHDTPPNTLDAIRTALRDPMSRVEFSSTLCVPRDGSAPYMAESMQVFASSSTSIRRRWTKVGPILFGPDPKTNTRSDLMQMLAELTKEPS